MTVKTVKAVKKGIAVMAVGIVALGVTAQTEAHARGYSGGIERTYSRYSTLNAVMNSYSRTRAIRAYQQEYRRQLSRQQQQQRVRNISKWERMRIQALELRNRSNVPSR